MRKRRETSFVVKIAVFAFAVFAVITILQLQLQYNSYKEKLETLNEEVEDLEEERDKLKNEYASIEDGEHVVDVAKEKLNLRLPEEIIFYNDLYNED